MRVTISFAPGAFRPVVTESGFATFTPPSPSDDRPDTTTALSAELFGDVLPFIGGNPTNNAQITIAGTRQANASFSVSRLRTLRRSRALGLR
jgi:hypothetical protein